MIDSDALAGREAFGSSSRNTDKSRTIVGRRSDNSRAAGNGESLGNRAATDVGVDKRRVPQVEVRGIDDGNRPQAIGFGRADGARNLNRAAVDKRAGLRQRDADQTGTV